MAIPTKMEVSSSKYVLNTLKTSSYYGKPRDGHRSSECGHKWES